MKKNLILLSLFFMSCSMVNVQVNAMWETEEDAEAQQKKSQWQLISEKTKSAINTIGNASKSTLKIGARLTGKVAWATLRLVPNFLTFPIKHAYYMTNDLEDVFKKGDIKKVVCAIYEGTALVLWLGALIYLMHGAAIAAQFLAANGILSTQTATGLEFVNQHTWFNPYFQNVLGYLKTLTFYELEMIKGCMCQGIKNLPGCLGNVLIQSLKMTFYTARAATYAGVRSIGSMMLSA